MEPHKKKVFKYFAVRIGNGVVIRRAIGPVEQVRSILKLPKLPSSPRRLEDGQYNEGVTFEQMCYTGGTIIGVIPIRLFQQKLGIATYTHKLIKLNLAQKRAVKALLEIE